MTTSNHALVLFAHGARHKEWAHPFEKIRNRLIALHPDSVIILTFLEIMQPSLEEAADELYAKGITHVTLVPLFMAQGGHLKKDLPRLITSISTKYPSMEFSVTSAIGETEGILNSIADWIDKSYKDNDFKLDSISQ